MIRFRNLSRCDLAAGLQLCRAARWNQLQRDWELFLRLSPAGCLVAVNEENVIGTVTTVRYQDRFSWIGMVLVDPALRRHGIGTQLLREALEILRDEETVKLDATPAGREVYLKLDFVDEYRLSRMEAVVSKVAEIDSNARLMVNSDLTAVLEMDRQVFGADRRIILDWMLEGAPEYAWLVTENSELKGYCFGRHGYNCEHLGPVIAPDVSTAQQLVSACLRAQAGKRFILDAAQHDAQWLAWLGSLGFNEQRPFVRMYRGSNRYPGVSENQFAILGPELG
jgi:GNAT superfamily N-acetyltransferase